MALLDLTIDGRVTHAFGRPYSVRSRRRKSSSRSKKRRPPPAIDADALRWINTVEWDVRTLPRDARYGGIAVSKQILDKCLGNKISLIVPAASKSPTDLIGVLYELVIEKKKVTIRDVLSRLAAFYSKRLTRTDMDHLSVMNSLHLTSQTRFGDLLGINTRFAGLVPQSKNVFVVRLVPNT